MEQILLFYQIEVYRPTLAPIPILLACSHVHNYGLKRYKKRSSFGIIIESAEPREPHHFALFLDMVQVQLILTWLMK